MSTSFYLVAQPQANGCFDEKLTVGGHARATGGVTRREASTFGGSNDLNIKQTSTARLKHQRLGDTVQIQPVLRSVRRAIAQHILRRLRGTGCLRKGACRVRRLPVDSCPLRVPTQIPMRTGQTRYRQGSALVE